MSLHYLVNNSEAKCENEQACSMHNPSKSLTVPPKVGVVGLGSARMSA